MVPYIDCWQDAVFSQPTWLKLHLEKVCKVMLPRTAAASKYGEKSTKPILMGDSKESLPLFCPTAQIREFLGPAGFCQIWIPNYFVLSKFLYKATKWVEEKNP
jgi:hypothetical protein